MMKVGRPTQSPVTPSLAILLEKQSTIPLYGYTPLASAFIFCNLVLTLSKGRDTHAHTIPEPVPARILVIASFCPLNLVMAYFNSSKVAN
jgi:hypothetical protein